MGRNPLRYRTPTDDQKLYGLIAYKKKKNFWTCTKTFLPFMVTYHPMIYLL